MLVKLSRFGFRSEFEGSRMETPCASFCIGARCVPSRERRTSWAFAARRRKVTVLSAWTSGEMTGAGAAGGCANAGSASKRAKRGRFISGTFYARLAERGRVRVMGDDLLLAQDERSTTPPPATSRPHNLTCFGAGDGA